MGQKRYTMERNQKWWTNDAMQKATQQFHIKTQTLGRNNTEKSRKNNHDGRRARAQTICSA